jgi:broad specificity phosphatase PhoE
MTDFRALPGRFDFYFLRHGESEGNSARLIQGRGDYPLSETGREQARRVAGWFAERRIGRLLSSPLARALQTARILADRLGLAEVELREELNELDTGLFTGLTVEQIRTRHSEAWRSFQRESWEGVPGAERIVSLLARAERLWELLAGSAVPGRAVLCVTHSGIMQWVLKATLGCRTWMPVVPMGNCSISRFSVDNRREGEPLGYYAEWSLINRQPFGESRQDGHLFLKP